ncbi:hypothetical protein [Yoonia sp. SDW83-1]|uniref:hypothetical protein n=1 Tax=Yoonia sp. SDW83-1 TaxID=3366945 RepID=UPI00398C60F1
MKFTLKVACALTCLAAGSPLVADTAQSDLIGVWQTGLTEAQAPGGGPSAYLRQTTVFTDTLQDIRAEIFADADGQMLIFTYASSGPYMPVGASDVVPGALNLELINETSEVTIYMDVPDLMAAVGMGDCDLILNEAINVRDCISGPPFLVTDCTDLDLVLVDQGGSRLRFGDQSIDRCISRPTELDAAQFFKVEQ